MKVSGWPTLGIAWDGGMACVNKKDAQGQGCLLRTFHPRQRFIQIACGAGKSRMKTSSAVCIRL